MSLPPKNSAKQREHDRARILTLLLADDALTESLLDPQGEQDAALRDQTSELTRLVNSLPAADIADALESLPPDERHVLWQQVDADKHGQILVAHVELGADGPLVVALETHGVTTKNPATHARKASKKH